jgi:hypothetical protein
MEKRRNNMVVVILSVLLTISIIYGIITTIGILKALNKVEYFESRNRQFKEKINNAYVEMQDIDAIGAFESDDDTGVIFQELKSIVEDVNSFINTEI